MTELALPQQPSGDVALPTITAVSLPGLEVAQQWAQALDYMGRLIGPLVDTALVPVAHWPLPAGSSLKEWPNPRQKHPRESIEEWQWRRSVAAASATGAAMRGLQLGLDPYTAVDQIFVVHGRPGLYVKLKWAMVVSRGHELWVEDASDESVTVCGRRKGWPQDRIERRTITIEQARKAGWTRNDAYEKTPRDMLENRAASRVIDKIAGDVIFGLPSVEELGDEPAVETPAAAHVTVEQIAGRALDHVAAAKADVRALASVLEHAEHAEHAERAPAPDVDPAPPAAAEAPKASTAAQWKRITTRLDGLDVGPADDKLSVIGAVIGRRVDKGSDLTSDEAQLVLDNLAGDHGHKVAREALAPPVGAERQDPPIDPWGINQPPAVDEPLGVPGDDQ